MSFGDNWTLDLGDCRHAFSSIGPTDHLITDPPYSKTLYQRTSKVRRSAYINKADGRARNVSSNEAQRALERGAIGAAEEIIEDVAVYAGEFVRRWVIVFHGDASRDAWVAAMESTGFRALRTSVWLKTDPMPQLSGDRPAQDVEYFTAFHRKGSRWNGGGKAASIVCGRAKGKSRPKHPSPKPIQVMNHIVQLFTDPGELVLDPFAGSGTTGVACLRLGRRFYGIERNHDYHALACERLRSEESQTRMEV